ncbi:MAG TPA: signal recognition particle-docking protein FtsY [Actinomycetes bacterium]|nr:signal recognition particle-docking protein FtsY [Actinomycetes bacterium]
MDPLSLVIVIAVALLLVGGVAFVAARGRGGRRSPSDQRGRAATTTRTAPHVPGVGDDAAPPRDTPKRTISTIELPEESGDGHDGLAVLERPEQAEGRMARLRSRLARSGSLGQGIVALLSRPTVDEETWEAIEDSLIAADLGVAVAGEVVDRLRSAVRANPSAAPRELLRAELLQLVDPNADRTLAVPAIGRPAVVLVVGVNGTGKTTTTGKLARVLVADDRDVVLGAADTFRAAAADQLQTWGDRVGVPVVRGPEGSDPASVAFEAVTTAIAAESDVLVVDTAGRLHTKAGLMDELGKVKRVIEKRSPVDEVLLVLDATTGQNGLAQARVFAEVVDVTGVVLTKLDGTAKGGIVVSVQRELGVPVKLVGLGEGPDDLAPFDPEVFVDALAG